MVRHVTAPVFVQDPYIIYKLDDRGCKGAPDWIL